MADPETQQPVDVSQQMTSKHPTTKQKDPKKSRCRQSPPKEK